MLNEKVEISGWHAAWLERSLPALNTYTELVAWALSFALITLGVTGCLGVRRSVFQLKNSEDNADSRAAAYRNINRRILKVCRANFYISNILLLNILIFAAVDAYVGLVTLSNDATENPERWDSEFTFEVVAYCAYISALFAGALFLAPLAQMVLITWVLGRFTRKAGGNTLADFIPEARYFTTYIAQIWTMVCFFITAYWPPLNEDTSMKRWLVLQACLGSAVAWLDASFMFNFCARRLVGEDLVISHGRVADIVCMFGRTVKVVHFRKADGEVLPKYEQLPQPDSDVSGKT